MFRKLSPSVTVLVSLIGTGCAGTAASTDSSPFVGKTFSRMSVPLVGGTPGSVLLMVQNGGEIYGSLVMNVSLPGPKSASVLQINYSLHGQLSQSDGSFNASFDHKPYRIYGNLPIPPSHEGGNFVIEANGSAYGPFTFGAATLT